MYTNGRPTFYLFFPRNSTFFFCFCYQPRPCSSIAFRSFRDYTLLRWSVLLYFLRTMNLVIGEVGVRAPAPHRARLSPSVRYPDQYRSGSPAAGLPKPTPRTAPRNLRRRAESCYDDHHPTPADRVHTRTDIAR